MNQPTRHISLLSAGVAVVGGIAFVTSIALRGPTGGIQSTPVRALVVATLILSALIVALPPWRWWTLVGRAIAMALLATACAAFVIPSTLASAGLLAAVTLTALACVATLLSGTAGRWPAALSSSAVLGLTLYAMLAPVAPEFDPRNADRFADISQYAAVALAAAALALLMRAWGDAPLRSLKMPRWTGLAIIVVFMSLSFSAWHLLVSGSRAAIAHQTTTNEKALGAFVRNNLEKMLNSLMQFNTTLTGAAPSDSLELSERFELLRSTYPGLLSLRWVNPDHQVIWQDGISDFTLPTLTNPINQSILKSAVDKAHQTGDIAVAGPFALDTNENALIFALALPSRGSCIALFSMRRSMAPWEQTFAEPFETEIHFRGSLLYEHGILDGPTIRSSGQTVPIGGETLTLKVKPTVVFLTSQRTTLPNFLLAAMLTASILLGLTAYFAQTSAHRANIAAQSRIQLEQLIRGAGQVAIIATDPAGLITIFNHGAEQLTGRRSIDLVRRESASILFDSTELHETVPSAATTLGFEPLAAIANGSRAYERDWTWKRPDGGQRRVNLAANPWRDTTGELLGYLFVAVDVTQREAAMRALDDARNVADRASDMKSSFLATVSHEIRTPMTAILGYADLLRDAATTPAERTEFAQCVRHNGEHLLRLINDILDISKVEAGRMNIEMLEVQLTEIVDEVVQTLRGGANAKGIDLLVQHDSAEIEQLIRTDPLRVRQILVNLIGNALKFTQRGVVTVVMRATIDDNAMFAEVEVRDTGIGISVEHIKVLFQSYEQADSSTARRFGGTGLGLAISQRLARLLDGSITVKSTLNEGSSFTFAFRAPLAASSLATPPIRDDATNQVVRLDNRRVLLVDDSPDSQRLIATLLRRAGATVVVADNGRKAIEAIALGSNQHEFDVILLDMQMPELDGYATARELRASGYHGRIVALTGNAGEGDRNRCLEAGCDDYAVKPVGRAKLIAICATPPLTNG